MTLFLTSRPSLRVPLSKFLRVAGLLTTDLRAAAFERWELHPAEEAVSVPAIMLPGQLDRVRSVQAETTREAEMRRALGGLVKHGATEACRLRDVALISGYVYGYGSRIGVVHRRPPLFAARPHQQIVRGAVVSTPVGARYFGHWLTDDCTTSLLEPQIGRTHFLKAPRSWTHVAQYRELFGIDSPEIVAARFEELTLVIDIGQNANRRARFRTLRGRLRSRLRPIASQGVYLRRGSNGGRRSIHNEEEIVDQLSRRGFEIVDVTRASARQIAERVAGAPLAIGVEGSHMAHATMSLPLPGGLICLQPPTRFTNIHKDYADCIGFHYGLVVGSSVGEGFRVSVDEILRTTDAMRRAIETRPYASAR